MHQSCCRRASLSLQPQLPNRLLINQLPAAHRRRRQEQRSNPLRLAIPPAASDASPLALRIQLNRSCCPPRSLSAAHRRWRRGVCPSSRTLSASALPLLCPIAARSPYAAIGRQRPIKGLPYGATIRLLPAKALVLEVDLAHIFPGFSNARNHPLQRARPSAHSY